jgi:hypothetical protein
VRAGKWHSAVVVVVVVIEVIVAPRILSQADLQRLSDYDYDNDNDNDCVVFNLFLTRYSAFHQRNAQTAGTHLPQSRRHGAAGLGHRRNDAIEVFPVLGGDLVLGDQPGVIGLDGASLRVAAITPAGGAW